MSLVKCCFDTPEVPDVIDTMVQKCTDPRCKQNYYNIFLIKTNNLRFIFGAKWNWLIQTVPSAYNKLH